MKETILLTGATGFVGRQVLSALAEQKQKVRIVVRDGAQAQLMSGAVVEKIITTQDMFSESADWWEQACDEVDTVIHVAWYAEPGKYLQSPRNLECLTGTLNMATGAHQAAVRRLIGIGSCFEYDLTDGRCSVDTPLKPLTLYAAAKTAVFLTLSQLLPYKGVEFLWCRLFYLYGEREHPHRLVPYLRSMLEAGQLAELTSGDQIRDFTDVVAAGQMIADHALGRQQGAVNICSGVPVTVREIAEKIADEYGRRDLLQFRARPDNDFDPPCVVGVK